MNNLSKAQDSIEAAKKHYENSDKFPYHNWEHVQDVMECLEQLGNLAVRGVTKEDLELLQIAAAWHDAEYSEPIPKNDRQTKEERSANLVADDLRERGVAQADIVNIKRWIIDTTVVGDVKRTDLGSLLHIADLGYFAAKDHEIFMDRLKKLKNELGPTVKWEGMVKTTRQFGDGYIKESEDTLKKFLETEGIENWVSRITQNLKLLETEFENGDLKDEVDNNQQKQ